MPFNWLWKRHEVKPLPKSRFPIKIKIEESHEAAPAPAESSGGVPGDFNKADCNNRTETGANCSCCERDGDN